MSKAKEFDPTVETWDRFVLRLQHSLVAEKITDTPENSDQRRSILCQAMGIKLYNQYLDVIGTTTAATHTFQQIVDAVKGIVQPAPLEISERFKFAKRRQLPSEMPSEYLAALRQMALTCSFAADDGQVEQKRLRDQFVFGLASEEAQRYLLQQPTLTLDTAVSLADQFTRARETAALLQSNSRVEVSKISRQPASNPIVGNSNPIVGKMGPCSHCGQLHSAFNCKFRQAKCYRCGKLGHISKVCRSSVPDSDGPTGNNRRALGNRLGRSSQRRKVKAVEADDGESSEDEINYVNHVRGSNPKYMVDVEINSKKLTLEVDTGSGSTILSKTTWEKIGSPSLRVAKAQFQSYSGHDLPILGCGRLDVKLLSAESGIKKCREQRKLLYYVVDSGKPSLLGRQWIESLGIQLHSCRRKPVSDSEVNAQQRVDDQLTKLLVEFNQLFDGTLGKIKDVKASVTMNSDPAVRKFWSARPVPYALEKKVELELDRLVSRGILERVHRDVSEYASPIVVVSKRDSEAVRICADFKVSINRMLAVEQYPLPRTEDLFARLAGCKIFTTLDLSEAFHQIELDEDAQKVLVVNTKKGLYKYKRLPFGIASAPAIFQRTMEMILRGLDGTMTFIDDVLVAGRTPEEHWSRLRAVLQRCQEYGVRLNLKKCKFGMSSVNYLGHTIDGDGIHASTAKIQAMKDAPRPKNLSELRAFCGLVNYYGKFVPTLATILAPLYALMKKDVKWKWTNDEENAFQTVKEKLSEPPVLCHFDPNVPLGLAVDASAYGVGATLFHTYDGGIEKPIAFASRSLNPAQKNYAQIEKEAYAIIYGVSKFRQYLYENRFKLVTDHKPLLAILSPSRAIPDRASSRIQRWALALQSYQYDMQFKKTSDHANADGLSRLPLISPGDEEIIDIFDIDEMDPDAIPTSKQLEEATKKDRVLSKVLRYIHHGWPAVVPEELQAYKRHSSELGIENNCVFWGQRAVIPSPLHREVLEELHQGHLGIVKMKSLARSLVWWPGLDKDLEQMVRRCAHCQSVRPDTAMAQVHPWEFPEKPWDRLHIDFAGPFQGLYWLIIIDARTKWPEVVGMKRATAWNTVKNLMSSIVRFGIPSQIVSDNGPQFISEEFQKFCQRFNITHIRSSPYHPRSNGEAERFVRTFKNVLGSKHSPMQRIIYRLNRFLLAYRNSAHATTGQSPAQMMFGRRVRLPLDTLHRQPDNMVRKSQQKQAQVGVTPRHYLAGDTVWARNYSSGFRWTPATISHRRGPLTYMVETITGKQWKRHVDQLMIRDPHCPTTPFKDQLVYPPLLEPVQLPVPVIPAPETGVHPPIAASEDKQPVEAPQSSSTQEATTEPTKVKDTKPKEPGPKEQPPLRRSTRSNFGKKPDRLTYPRK